MSYNQGIGLYSILYFGTKFIGCVIVWLNLIINSLLLLFDFTNLFCLCPLDQGVSRTVVLTCWLTAARACLIPTFNTPLKLFTWSQTMLWATRVSSFKFSTSTSLLTLKLSSTVACPCDKIRISFYNIEKTLVDLVCHAFKEYPLCLPLIGS